MLKSLSTFLIPRGILAVAIALALLFGMFSLTNGAGLIMQGIGLRKNRQTLPSVVPHRKAA